ncbi:MAG: isoprenylcysteine carboxyl methyltransferase [Rhodobacter sp.]|nr:isoprenylcysteine carboxyl methyltransferase [Rhodobacter sp.]
MTEPKTAYGPWLLVFINSAVFIIFAFSFFKPQTSRDLRSFGALSALVVALFMEKYGFPFTIFLLSVWLQWTLPDIDCLAQDSWLLPEMIFGRQSNPHFGPFHILSFALIGGGFWLISVAWHHLWSAQRQGRLATTGPYARIRHPQHVGFVLIMLGFHVQWLTILTLSMFPLLVWIYARLTLAEEAYSREQFGEGLDKYAGRVPAFVPNHWANRSDDRQYD